MNTYKTSNGDRISQSLIDRLIRKAKGHKLRDQFESDGYNHCENCGISNGTFLDCSHDISVKQCKETSRTELAFDTSNITILCRSCHQKKDKLNTQWRK